MEYLEFFVVGLARALLTVVEGAFFLRTLFSLFLPDDDNFIMQLLYLLTEPFVLPVRKLFEHFDWFQDGPLDVSYLVAFLLISAISMFV